MNKAQPTKKNLDKLHKKLLQKMQKKFNQASKFFPKKEGIEFSEFFSKTPTSTMLICHFGSGTGQDYQGVSSWLGGLGLESQEYHLDMFPGYPHGFLTLKNINVQELEDEQQLVEDEEQNTLKISQILQKMEYIEKDSFWADEVNFEKGTRIVLLFYSSLKGNQFDSYQANNIQESELESSIPGLEIIREFIDQSIEQEILDSIGETNSSEWGEFAKRGVRVFGEGVFYFKAGLVVPGDGNETQEISEGLEVQEGGFQSGSPNKKTEQKMMNIFRPIYSKASTSTSANTNNDEVETLKIIEFDSLEAGIGKDPHNDSHTHFGENTLLIALKAGIEVTFLNQDFEKKKIYLSRGDAFKISGESRYRWFRAVKPRKYDKIQEKYIFRKDVLLVTLKSLNSNNNSCSCPYPKSCQFQDYSPNVINLLNVVNSEKRRDQKVVKNDDDEQALINEAIQNKQDQGPSSMEKKYVYEVYEKIAHHFSNTRYKPWPQVEQFLLNLPKGSIVADVGCGNGKYLTVNPDLIMVGTDISNNLLKFCVERKATVFRADSLHLPVKTGSFDYVISIAVVHHFSTPKLRKKALEELIRIVRVGGRVMVTVWAHEQNKRFESQDVFVPWNLEDNFHKENIEKKVENEGKVEQIEEDGAKPEVYKDQEKNTVVYKRYYHLFVFKELEELLGEIGGIEIVDNFYNRDNWCVIIEKKGDQI